MNILYIGDIMGKPGIQVIEEVLTDIKQQHSIDLTLAQAENVTDGRGISVADYNHLKQLGVDAFMSGNWTMYRDEINPYLENENHAITRPANYPEGTIGKKYKEIETKSGTVLLVSLLGHIVGKDAEKPVDNALKVIDEMLDETKQNEYAARVVNFHGDYSSEKRVIGYYLDGRVSAVIGDHWHVPTADAMILPKSTAHITDVGMCGTMHSSLGVELEIITSRWRDNKVNRNQLATSRPFQFNAVVIQTDNTTGLAVSVHQIQSILN